MRTLVLCCAVAAVAARNLSGVQQPQRIDDAIDSAVVYSKPAAQAAMDTFRRIVNGQNYKALGFASLGDIQSATPDTTRPLVAFHVGRDSLRKYHRGGDPFTLLRGGDRIFYAVLVKKRTRSSIILARDTTGWKGVSYGGPVTAKLYWTALSRAPHPLTTPPRRYYLVQVLALNTDFLAFHEDTVLSLIPVLDDPQYRWRAGASLLADWVFALLAVDARAADDLPR